MTRRIENRIEVPGTPEEVWELIATGHGIEAWFVPAEVEPRVGGRVAIDIGTGMEECGTVSAWEPPHRFAYDEERAWRPSSWSRRSPAGRASCGSSAPSTPRATTGTGCSRTWAAAGTATC